MLKRICLIFLYCLSFFFLTVSPATGQIIGIDWVRRYDGPASSIDEAFAIAVDDSGNVYVTGKSWGGSTGYDFATIKYYPDGDTAWIRRYNGTGNGDDRASAIDLDESGNIYVSGPSYGSGTDDDYLTIKYYPDGETAWVRRYNGMGNSEDNVSAMTVDFLGNVYITGYSTGSGSDFDYTTIKYYPNGDTAWVRNYNGAGNGKDNAVSIVLDNSDNIYVTGYCQGSGTYADYTTIKYYPNGDTTWVRTYNGPKNSWDYASDIAIDAFDNAYVTGYSYNNQTDFDYLTIKYYPNGDTAWIRRYDGEANSVDEATSIALDGDGYIYVTGRSLGNFTDFDYLTIKYFPDGNIDWIRKFDGTVDDDRAYDIAMDDSGKVYVTGTTGYGTGVENFATVAYYPNGDTAWVRSYDGPAGGSDHASAITVDHSYNIYVTGVSEGSGTTYDYATIKYRLFQLRSDTLWFVAYSPVDLIVNAPNEDSIGVNFNTIPGATYDTLSDLNGDQESDDLVIIPKPVIGDYTVKVVAEPEPGSGNYTLSVKINGNENTPMLDAVAAPGPAEIDTVYYPVTEYLRGDPNSDGYKNISDVVYLINYIFNQGPGSLPWFLGDANCNGEVTASDIVYLINYLFKQGKAPCS
jgi:hypothetical protein